MIRHFLMASVLVLTMLPRRPGRSSARVRPTVPS